MPTVDEQEKSFHPLIFTFTHNIRNSSLNTYTRCRSTSREISLSLSRISDFLDEAKKSAGEERQKGVAAAAMTDGGGGGLLRLIEKMTQHTLREVRSRAAAALRFKIKHKIVSVREARMAGAAQALVKRLEVGEEMDATAYTLMLLLERQEDETQREWDERMKEVKV